MCLCTLATDCQIRRPAAGSGDPAGARCDFCPYFLRRYGQSFARRLRTRTTKTNLLPFYKKIGSMSRAHPLYWLLAAIRASQCLPLLYHTTSPNAMPSQLAGGCISILGRSLSLVPLVSLILGLKDPGLRPKPLVLWPRDKGG